MGLEFTSSKNVRLTYEKMSEGLYDGIMQTSITQRKGISPSFGAYECVCLTRQEYDKSPVYSLNSHGETKPLMNEYHIMALKTSKWIILYSLNVYVKYNNPDGSFTIDPYILDVYRNGAHTDDKCSTESDWDKVFKNIIIDLLFTKDIDDDDEDEDIDDFWDFVRLDDEDDSEALDLLNAKIKIMYNYLNEYAVKLKSDCEEYDLELYKFDSAERREVVDIVMACNKHKIWVPIWRLAGSYNKTVNRRKDFKNGWKCYYTKYNKCTLMVRKKFKNSDGSCSHIYVPSKKEKNKFVYDL